MFRAQLTWSQSTLLGLAVGVGGVSLTYPGGWERLFDDVRHCHRYQREQEEVNQVNRQLNAEVVQCQWRQEIQATRIAQLAAGRLSLRAVAEELDSLYEPNSKVRAGIRMRFPTATDDELMAAMACYRASEYHSLDERRTEALHEEFRQLYRKPLPAQVLPLHLRSESNPQTRRANAG